MGTPEGETGRTGWGTFSRESAAPGTARLQRLITAEQVKTLYKQSVPVLLANVVNAAIVCAVLWGTSPAWMLLGWLGLMLLVVAARVELRRRYWATSPTVDDAPRWARRFTTGTVAAACLWGAGGALLVVPGSLVSQVLLAFVIGGMCAGAAGTLSCYLPAYYLFVVPSLTPLAARLLLEGDELQLAMGAMLVLFGIAITLVARNVNQSVLEAYGLRFENLELLDRLTSARENLEHVNAQLEQRVAERTAELRRQTEAAQASQKRLSELVEHSPDGIVLVRSDGVLDSCNPALERITGYAAADQLGRSLLELPWLPPEARKKAKRAFDDTLTGAEQTSTELTLEQRGGRSVTVEINLNLIRRTDGPPLVEWIVRDITERREAEKARAELAERLRQSQRMEAVGRLAGGVAHDFNNLLTVVLNNVDELLSSPAMDTETEGAVREIRDASARAASLTRQLLAFGRRQMLTPTVFNLNDAVEEIARILTRLIGEHIELEMSLSRESAIIKADRGQIEQVIINLTTNARDAMPTGGKIEVSTALIELDEEFMAKHGQVEAGKYVELAVQDTGLGMDEETLEKIFEPFFTTKNSKGTGLGLATVHGVVRQSGGYIFADSELRKGTRVSVYLPFCPEVPAARSATPLRVRAPDSETVLVVEDEPLVRDATARVLRAAGYTILTARDGKEALEVARQYDGTIHVLISDVVMPKLSGPALARQMSAARPQVRVLLVSGYTGDALRDAGTLEQGIEFLQKPFTPQMLTQKVRELLSN